MLAVEHGFHLILGHVCLRNSLLAAPGLYSSPRLSPDGQRLALQMDSGSGKGPDTYV